MANTEYQNNKYSQLQTVSGETPFRIFAESFCVTPSAQGYTVHYSADGKSWTPDVKAMAPNETHNFFVMTPGMYFKLVGNTDTVKVLSKKVG